MSPERPADHAAPEDDDYNESEDEDFRPDAADRDDSGSSDDEAATKVERPRGPKQARGKGDEAEDLGFENSGDEAILKRGAKRKRKHTQGSAEDSGGEGGFVKTRSMRAVAAEEKGRRPLATNAGVTIDVNAVWETMNSPAAIIWKAPSSPHQEEDVKEVKAKEPTLQQTHLPTDDLIEIQQKFKFAGELQTAKKLVPRSSEEGRKWLETHPEQGATARSGDSNISATTSKAKRHPDTGEPLLRPLRRVSLWDPNPTGVVRGLPTNVVSGAATGNKLRVVDKSKLDWHTNATTKAPKATKLNVVEKSKMDWTAHVDETGDKEDLAKAAKAKGAYLERKDFLERVEARKEEEERRIRVK